MTSAATIYWLGVTSEARAALQKVLGAAMVR
jgi:hypothetical protein